MRCARGWMRRSGSCDGCSRRRSAEELLAEAQRADELPKEQGETTPKSGVVVKGLARRFKESHEAYGYVASGGPSIELAIMFQARS